MEILRISSPSAGAGIALGEVLQYYKERPVLLMVSGGSAFSILDFIVDDVLGPSLTLSVLDERCSYDPKINNFLQLKETPFFKRAIAKGVGVISTEIIKGERCGAVADEWERELFRWTLKNPDGIILATMGIGEDGHVAGIFPNVDEELFNSDELVVSYSVPPEVNKYTDRITVTNTFLREYVDGAIVYAVGKEKKKIIKMLEKDDDLAMNDSQINEVPAKILKQMKLVSLYTDI